MFATKASPLFSRLACLYVNGQNSASTVGRRTSLPVFPSLVCRGVSGGSASGRSGSSKGSSGNHNNNPTASQNETRQPASFEPVYVHPLSQIVLMYLQEECHEWIVQRRVDALRVHRDGTFVLEFPQRDARIWTYYDPSDKKHWLSYRKHQIQHRFLLQDNLMPAWNGNKRQSLPERIQKSVQEMVQAVNELEEGN